MQRLALPVRVFLLLAGQQLVVLGLAENQAQAEDSPAAVARDVAKTERQAASVGKQDLDRIRALVAKTGEFHARLNRLHKPKNAELKALRSRVSKLQEKLNAMASAAAKTQEVAAQRAAVGRIPLPVGNNEVIHRKNVPESASVRFSAAEEATRRRLDEIEKRNHDDKRLPPLNPNPVTPTRQGARALLKETHRFTQQFHAVAEQWRRDSAEVQRMSTTSNTESSRRYLEMDLRSSAPRALNGTVSQSRFYLEAVCTGAVQRAEWAAGKKTRVIINDGGEELIKWKRGEPGEPEVQWLQFACDVAKVGLHFEKQLALDPAPWLSHMRQIEELAKELGIRLE